MADECGCLYRSECKIHGGVAMRLRALAEASVCTACAGTGRISDGEYRNCSICDGTGNRERIEGIMGSDKGFTVRTVASPCSCRWEKHPMSLMPHKDSTGCEVHGIFRPVGPPLVAHQIDIVECERAEALRLRELLSEAMRWLDDPSAYHGTQEPRDFDRCAREALGWSAAETDVPRSTSPSPPVKP